MALLEVNDLNVCFNTSAGVIEAASNVTFEINKGEIFGIIGESGSGKSVIGLSILKLLPASAEITGRIKFEGRNLLELSEREMSSIRGKSISLVPQNPSGSLDPLMKNVEQIAEVYYEDSIEKAESRKRAIEILRTLHFDDSERVAKMYPHQLSGGMKQKLLVGATMTRSPRLIIADEPTKGLDLKSRRNVSSLLAGLEDQERSLLVITHDVDLAFEICDRIAVVYAGEIVEMGKIDDVVSEPMHPYTKGLLGSTPRNGLTPIPGLSPNLLNLPVGCYFSERCSQFCSEKKEACLDEHPDIYQTNKGRWIRCHVHT